MRVIAFLLAATGACAAACAGYTNVALGKPVSVVQGPYAGAGLASLVDDVFRPRGTSWTSGTVYWNGLNTIIEINLLGTYRLFGGIVQGDDNDVYRILYRNMDTGLFETLWDVPNYDGFGNGMQTRPNPSNDDEIYFFDVARVTDTIRFVAISGDNSYSVSEIQVYIPAPASGGLLALGGLASLRRRR